MKQKVCHKKMRGWRAMQIMLAVTREDLGFFITCGIALAVFLKLACV